MQSIKDIYVIGYGPSSSHTMGPAFAAEYIIKKYPNIKKVTTKLYASLALTGKGHLTDYIIKKTFDDAKIPNEVVFKYVKKVEHPNTMKFEITFDDNTYIEETVISIGGGSILTSEGNKEEKEIYNENKMNDIIIYCRKNDISLYQYVLDREGPEIVDYVRNVYNTMKASISRGLAATGVLPGSLQVSRKAQLMAQKAMEVADFGVRRDLLVSSAAYAVAEENASGGIVVTAPTCGSSGVIPGIITYLRLMDISDEKIIEGLIVAGLIGKIIKTNASVSGAVGGCQAEIGSAAAMGAAMIIHCLGRSNRRIAIAAEMALEHSLGLTCDPIRGYVQIPCIERNAIFALKAINAATICSVLDKDSNKISLDDVIQTMHKTGLDLKAGYKETSKEGLSKLKQFN